MNLALQEKNLVIIGGTAGIGLSGAQAFIAAGARVVVIGRHPDDVLAAQQQLGDSARAILGDARQPDAAYSAIQECLNRFGPLHGLYHVAGGSGRAWGDGPLHELTDTGWEQTLLLNLTTIFYSNRAAVQQFMAQGSGGSILNVGSVLSYSPSPQFFHTHAYTAAKSGLLGFTKACAAYYAPRNIRFNVLAPGLVETPMAQRAARNPTIMEFIKIKQPLDGGRIGQPADLEGAAVYLLSDLSKFVTGQVLTIDGGWSVSEGQSPKNL